MVPLPTREPDLRILVRGEPAPGGSKTPIPLKRGGKYVTKNGRPVIRIIDAGKGNARWKDVVRAHAAIAMRARDLAEPLTGPVVLITEFIVARPASHINSRGEVKPTAPRYPASRPDVLKLMRSTEDAMTNVVWVDDAQVIRQSLAKDYAPPGGTPGAIIRIWHLTTEELSWVISS
jgi:Holliday junction resolvase RusA-like endonuclease